MTVTIPLSRGYVATIDESDMDAVSAHKWYASVTATGHVYAATAVNDGETSRMVKMHRMLMQAPAGMDVDHIDGNTLNNSRTNLRLCTRSQNLGNMRTKRPDLTSQFKGVSFRKDVGQWCATINRNGKRVRVGHFRNELAAAKAYDAAAIEVYGEFAATNAKLFPDLMSYTRVVPTTC